MFQNLITLLCGLCVSIVPDGRFLYHIKELTADDLIVDVTQPQKNLQDARSNGFLALLVDGSVRFIKDAINPETLKALFTRKAGDAATLD